MPHIPLCLSTLLLLFAYSTIFHIRYASYLKKDCYLSSNDLIVLNEKELRNQLLHFFCTFA